MSELPVIILQCGTFILVPAITFGLGLWLIVHFLGTQHRLAMIFFALLIGVVFFEVSVIGMAIDPSSSSIGWTEIFTTAGRIGIGAALFVLIFNRLYVNLIKIFKQ